MVDDIDRLEPEEIRQVFNIIKALADFPNVIYLVAFDQSVVRHAIETQTGMSGLEYLEKIIQVPFTMPQVDKKTLSELLTAKILDIIGASPEELLNDDPWSNWFNYRVEKFFKVPRDVTRFCNSLSVTYPPVRGEVNPSDFITIEAIRVFFPKLYGYLSENPEKFIVDQSKFSDQQIDLIKILEKTVDETDLHYTIEKLIIKLFPAIKNDRYDPSEMRKRLHVSCPDFFPNYFRFNPNPKLTKYAKIKELLKSSKTQGEFESFLLNYLKQGIADMHYLLERLSDHIKSDIQVENIQNVLSALLNIGDKLIEDPSKEPPVYQNHLGPHRSNNITILCYCIYNLAMRIPMERRLVILDIAISQGDSIYIQGRTLSNAENATKGIGESPLIAKKKLPHFKELWIQNIRKQIKSGRLMSHPYLMNILLAWQNYTGDIERIKEWCHKEIANDENLFIFIKRFIFYETTMTGAEKFIHFQNMENFVGVQEIYDRIQTLQGRNKIPKEYEEDMVFFLSQFERKEARANILYEDK